MKYTPSGFSHRSNSVAPLVGAWIEILSVMATPPTAPVAPLVGAWIEIDTPQTPSMPVNVAPLVGAWIEIQYV